MTLWAPTDDYKSTPSAGLRDHSIDALRTLGLIAVVAGHVFSDTFSRNLLYPWHVPIFFFVSGYLFRSVRSVKEEVWVRAKSLLLPYCFWLLTVLSAIIVLGNLTKQLVMPTPVSLVLGGNRLGAPFQAFWFVTALFINALLLRILSRQRIWLGLAVVLVACIATSLRPGIMAGLPFSAGMAVVGLVFSYAGLLTRSHRILSAASWTPAIALTTVAGTLFLSGSLLPIDLKQGNLGTPWFSLIAATVLCWGLLRLFQLCWDRLQPSQSIGRLFAAIAAAALPIVLSHGLFISLLPHELIWLQFSGAVLCSTALGLILSKSGLSLVSCGTKRQRHAASAPE